MRKNVIDLDAGRQQRLDIITEAETAECRAMFGSYENWSDQSLRYVLQEFEDGCMEYDDVSLLFGAGASLARADLDDDPLGALNAMWMAAETLITRYGADLDEESKAVAEAIEDVTRRYARPEYGRGWRHSLPFSGASS